MTINKKVFAHGARPSMPPKSATMSAEPLPLYHEDEGSLRGTSDDIGPVNLAEGERLGRFVILRSRDGTLCGIAAGSVVAVCEIDDGSLLMLPAGRVIEVPQSLATVLAWLDGRP